MTKHTTILMSRTKLVTCQLFLLVAIFFFWWLMTKPGLVPPFMFEDENQAAFFFGEPVQIFKVIWDWFFVNYEIYPNLWVTLTETVLAFAFGTIAGLFIGLWLALAPTAAAIADPLALRSRSVLRSYFSLCSLTFIRACVKSVRTFWRARECSAPIRVSFCATFIFRVRQAGCSLHCILPSVWLSLVRWSANT